MFLEICPGGTWTVNWVPRRKPTLTRLRSGVDPSSDLLAFLELDIILVIFSLVDKRTLSQCAQVCTLWNCTALKTFWSDALSRGVRPLLSYMDTHYVSDLVDPVSIFIAGLDILLMTESTGV